MRPAKWLVRLWPPNVYTATARNTLRERAEREERQRARQRQWRDEIRYALRSTDE